MEKRKGAAKTAGRDKGGASLAFLKYQLKNSRGVVCGYAAIYILLIVFCVAIRLGNVDVPLSDKYDGCSLLAHICTCILGALPMVFLASEMIESRKHPYMLVYAFRWGRRDNLLCHLLSLAFPGALYILISVLYGEAYSEYEDLVGGVARNAAYHFAIVFALSAMVFLIAALTQNVLVSLLCVMAYAIVMLFMDIPDVWFNAIALGNSISADAAPRAAGWLIAGIVFNEIGLRIYSRTS